MGQHFVERIYKPFVLLDKEDSELSYNIPSEFREIIELGDQVERARHPDYPQGVFFDNVKSHLIRLVLEGTALDLPPDLNLDREIIIRMLWVHDLPEVLASTSQGYDISAVLKEDDQELNLKILSSEDEIARKIFSPEDYKFYNEVGNAMEVLEKGNFRKPITLNEAYVAKLMDMGDGETGFYFFLTEWLLSEFFDGRLPTDRPYNFTMSRYGNYVSNVNKLKENYLRDFCRKLLEQQILYIIKRWELVKAMYPERLPLISEIQVKNLEGILEELAK